MKHSNKVLYLALATSLLIHIVFIVNGHFSSAIKSVEPTKLKPIELTLQEYTLNEQTPTLPTQNTKTIEQQEQAQIARQQQENQTIFAQAQTKEDTQKNTTTIDAAQANTQKGNLNLTGTLKNPLSPRDPKYNTQQRTTSNIASSDTIASTENESASEPQTVRENVNNVNTHQDSQPQETPTDTEKDSILITEKDIAQNKGIITPKGNQKITFPQSAQIKYTGPVPGEMSFQRSGNKYTITARLRIPFKNYQFKVEGTIVGNQFKPTRYTDTRGKNLYAYANFDYTNKLIIYGKNGEEKTSPLEENALDIFSAAWQLAFNGGTSSSLQITNGKSVHTYPSEKLSGVGTEYNQGEGKLRLKVFTIPNDTKKIEYGLAADFGNIPAYINFEGNILDPVNIKLNGQEYWKAVQRVK